MTYDQWKTRDPNDTGFNDPDEDQPTELDLAYERIRELESALRMLWTEVVYSGNSRATDCDWHRACAATRNALGYGRRK